MRKELTDGAPVSHGGGAAMAWRWRGDGVVMAWRWRGDGVARAQPGFSFAGELAVPAVTWLAAPIMWGCIFPVRKAAYQISAETKSWRQRKVELWHCQCNDRTRRPATSHSMSRIIWCTGALSFSRCSAEIKKLPTQAETSALPYPSSQVPA